MVIIHKYGATATSSEPQIKKLSSTNISFFFLLLPQILLETSGAFQ